MEKKKDKRKGSKSPLPQRSSALHFIKEQPSAVKQRTKADPVTVEGYLDLDRIRLKLIADPDDWERLEKYALSEDDSLLKSAIYHRFIRPAIGKIRGKKETERDSLIYKIRFDAKWLYAFFSYWKNRPLDQWPRYLNSLRDKIEQDCSYTNQKGKSSPQNMTEFCLSKVYDKRIETHELRPFDDPFNFYQTYVNDKKDPPTQKQLSDEFFKGKTPQEIAQYVYRHPFKDIFSKLKII